LLEHILHVLGLHEILHLLHFRRLQLGDDVNSVAILAAAGDPPVANFWWGIGLEHLKPLIKVLETMNSDEYGHFEPSLQRAQHR
jgi:hypothetical protein